MQKVLVIYYSQSGQLKDLAQNVVHAYEKSADYEVEYYNIRPKHEFQFPWNGKRFYGVFPESFQQIPVAIEPPSDDILNADYDLVLLAYQIWYLTPSIPVNSFMRSEYAKKILQDKPIVSIIGCRNMWAKASKKMKDLIDDAGGKLVGNLTFVDKHINHISVITIVHWMMTGKKSKKWGVFPKPGVSDKDIHGATQFGDIILEHHEKKKWSNLQDELRNSGGVIMKPFWILMDEKANKMFTMWSNFILKNKSKRGRNLTFFKIYLLTAIWVISPIANLLFILTYPFRIRTIKKQMEFYCGVN